MPTDTDFVKYPAGEQPPVYNNTPDYRTSAENMQGVLTEDEKVELTREQSDAEIRKVKRLCSKEAAAEGQKHQADEVTVAEDGKVRHSLTGEMGTSAASAAAATGRFCASCWPFRRN